MNYISSQSFHTLNHWQSGQGGRPIKKITTLEDLTGQKWNSFVFGGWVSGLDASGQTADDLQLLSFSYHEGNYTQSGSYVKSRINVGTDNRTGTVGGKCYISVPPDPSEVIYSKFYTDLQGDRVYFKILRERTLTEWVPEPVEYPENYYTLDNEHPDIQYYYTDSSGRWRNNGHMITKSGSTGWDNFVTKEFTKDYTGTVIIPSFQRYIIYMEEVTGTDKPDEIFSDSTLGDVENRVVVGNKKYSGNLYTIFQYDKDLQEIKELWQVPPNLIDEHVITSGGGPYILNNSDGLSARIGDYVKNPQKYYTAGESFSLTSTEGQFYGGYTGDFFTTTGTRTSSETFKGGALEMVLGASMSTSSTQNNMDFNRHEGTINENGVWETMIEAPAEFRTERGFKFFK